MSNDFEIDLDVSEYTSKTPSMASSGSTFTEPGKFDYISNSKKRKEQTSSEVQKNPTKKLKIEKKFDSDKSKCRGRGTTTRGTTTRGTTTRGTTTRGTTTRGTTTRDTTTRGTTTRDTTTRGTTTRDTTTRGTTTRGTTTRGTTTRGTTTRDQKKEIQKHEILNGQKTSSLSNKDIREKKIIYGNKKAWDSFKAWLSQDDCFRKPKIVLVTGPPGIGKSSGTRYFCEILGYDIVEVNASSERTKSVLITSVNDVLLKKHLKKTALILDELDGCHEGPGPSITSELIRLSNKNVKQIGPLICIANNRQNGTVKSLIGNMEKVKHIAMYPLDSKSMMDLLNYSISASPLGSISEEFKTMNKQQKEFMICQFNGDARALLNSSKFLSIPSSSSLKNSSPKILQKHEIAHSACRDTTIDIFNATEQILYGTCSERNQKQWAEAYFSKDPFLVQSMIFENYPQMLTQRLTGVKKTFDGLTELVNISSMLSDDDVIFSTDTFDATEIYSLATTYCAVKSPSLKPIYRKPYGKHPFISFSTLPGHVSKIIHLPDAHTTKLPFYEPFISNILMMLIEFTKRKNKKSVLILTEKLKFIVSKEDIGKEDFLKWWKHNITFTLSKTKYSPALLKKLFPH